MEVVWLRASVACLLWTWTQSQMVTLSLCTQACLWQTQHQLTFNCISTIDLTLSLCLCLFLSVSGSVSVSISVCLSVSLFLPPLPLSLSLSKENI